MPKPTPAAPPPPPFTPLGLLPGGSQIVAASQTTASQLLQSIDAFVQAQSPFDRQARLNLRASAATVTREMYLDYVSSQTLAWSPSEIDSLKKIVAAIAAQFQFLNVSWPNPLYLVKTTGQEEGHAAYTRRTDTIALPANMVATIDGADTFDDPLHPGPNLATLQAVITHECSHILSKNNPQVRARAYAKIGFQQSPSPIPVPQSPWGPKGATAPMCDLVITNPDQPGVDTLFQLTVPKDLSKPNGPKITRNFAPLLLASRPYNGGSMFDYLQWWFMAIQPAPNGAWRPELDPKGNPILLDSSNPILRQEYLKLVGANFSHEIFHPDEVLAQSFVLIAQQPDLQKLVQLRSALAP